MGILQATTNPSPSMGEGYGALATKELRRSWVRVSEAPPRAKLRFAPLTLRRFAAPPSPTRGEGLAGAGA
jgi:hypothetical protein